MQRGPRAAQYVDPFEHIHLVFPLASNCALIQMYMHARARFVVSATYFDLTEETVGDNYLHGEYAKQLT